MPPTMPIVSASCTASSVDGTPCVSPIATPAALSSATSSTARPFAESQPKNAAPHVMPP
jgi:hypothetical protein